MVMQSSGHEILCAQIKIMAVEVDSELWTQEILPLEWIELGG